MSTAHDFHIPEFGLGDRMALALRETGHTVNEAAAYFGVARHTITRWINNHTQPPLASLKLWALWTGVPLEWLQTGARPDPSRGGETGNTNGFITGWYPALRAA